MRIPANYKPCLLIVQAKLDAGEECLSTALPCDIAGLVKQFFRELPEPVLPSELQEAFIKAQQLPSEEERTSATMLLSCVLPDRNLTTLRHFFNFLQNVSKRCHNFSAQPFQRPGCCRTSLGRRFNTFCVTGARRTRWTAVTWP